MSTTKKGKLIHQVKPYDVQLKKLWRIGRECGRLTVQYRMGHTLKGMGVELKPTDWSKIVTRKSSKDRSSSSSSVELQESPQERSPEVSSPSRLTEQPAESTSIQSTDRHSNSSPSPRQTTPPLSLSPPPIFTQPTTILVARNAAGGLIYFPLLPVKSEPEDTTLQKCL